MSFLNEKRLSDTPNSDSFRPYRLVFLRQTHAWFGMTMPRRPLHADYVLSQFLL